MQKRIEATKGSASLLHKAIACIVSVMLATSYSSAYAFDGEVSDTTVATEDASASVAAAEESAESEGATATEEINEATSADAETGEAASFDAESDGADAFASLLSTSGRLAAISTGTEKATFASTQTNALQTLSNTDGHFTISGGEEGTDWTFGGNVIAIKEDGEYTITGDDCEDHSGYQVTVAGVTATITLDNVRISSSSGAAMNIDNTANVTLVLEGENSFTSNANYRAGIQFAGASEGASLEITSTTNGSLTAKGGSSAADIGGGGNGGSASSITISGGSVKATNESISVTPTNGDESNPQNVYLCKIENLSGVNEVTLDSTTYTRDGDHPDDDGTFYLYLTGENHEITADRTDYRAVWDGDASSFTLKTYIAAPSASFVAADDNSGTLSGVVTTMQYSLDGGTDWKDVTGETIEITGVTAANDILMRYAETDTEVSYTQTINVSQAAAPAATGVACTTLAQNNGQITGVNSSMKYRLSTDSVWTDITGNTATGLAPGTYYVRVKASGTQLASSVATVTVGSHTCAGQGDWLFDDNNHWKFCSCGEKTDEGSHFGGTATCEGQAVCATCGQSYGEVLGHDWEGPVWS